MDELKLNTVGIRNNFFSIQCLLYADDLVFLSETEIDLQNMLKILENWCKKWRMKVNVNKTGVIHFRKPRVERTNFVFQFDLDIVQVVDRYKYLGLVFHEY